MDAYIGGIFSWGFNFPPRGFMSCNGSLLSIASYTAVFALLGTTYGGDGVTTFALPNLQGRVPIGTGQGPGLSNYVIGQAGGGETVTLTTSQMPVHTHTGSAAVPVAGRANESSDPNTRYFGASSSAVGNAYNTSPNTSMVAGATSSSGNTGSSSPMSILSPFLVVNYSICVEGIFPSRN